MEALRRRSEIATERAALRAGTEEGAREGAVHAACQAVSMCLEAGSAAAAGLGRDDTDCSGEDLLAGLEAAEVLRGL